MPFDPNKYLNATKGSAFVVSFIQYYYLQSSIII